MPNLSSIKNSNPLIEKKVNFFHDFFQFYVYKAGKLHDFELENPSSLIEKIIYQIENNPNNYIQYIDEYFKNNYLNNDVFLQGFNDYNTVKNFISIYNQQTKSKARKNWLDNTPQFLISLKNLELDLQQNLFKKSLDSIISYLICEDDLIIHQEEIKYHTKIIVTEFFFNGNTYKDIQEAFDKIFSRDINEFPFPSNLKTKKQKEKYLINLNLKSQFEGLYHFQFRKIKERIYVFKIYGISFNTENAFEFDGVKLYNRENKLFEKFIKGSKTKELIYNDFFNKDEVYIIAVLKLSFRSSHIAEKKAINKIRNAIKFFDTKFERTLRLDTRFYLFTNDFKNFGWNKEFSNEDISLNEDDVYKLQETIYHFFKKPYSNAQKHILYYEHLWVEATKTKNISDYWHYLETMLYRAGEDKKVKITVGTINLVNENKRRKNELIHYLVQCLNFNIPKHDWGLSIEEADEIMRKINIGKISNKLKKVDYPFLKEILRLYYQKLDSISYSIIRDYFYSILNEAYAQRNFDIHKGMFNEKLYIKLEYTFPLIMLRFKSNLLHAAKNNKRLSFEELIDHLMQQGEKLTLS